jgi:regulator of sigma E protease
MDFLIWLLSYVVPFLVVLTVIVFVHEMGHYLVARWNGHRDPDLLHRIWARTVGFTDRHGTRWRISQFRWEDTSDSLAT